MHHKYLIGGITLKASKISRFKLSLINTPKKLGQRVLVIQISKIYTKTMKIKLVIECQMRRTRPMDLQNNTSGSADAEGTKNPHLTAPTDGAAATAIQTGPAPGKQPTKAPVWMKPCPEKPPKERQKLPRLGEKMKHLAPIFESQPNELQWTMHDNTKCVLDLREKYTERPRASRVLRRALL